MPEGRVTLSLSSLRGAVQLRGRLWKTSFRSLPTADDKRP